MIAHMGFFITGQESYKRVLVKVIKSGMQEGSICMILPGKNVDEAKR